MRLAAEASAGSESPSAAASRAALAALIDPLKVSAATVRERALESDASIFSGLFEEERHVAPEVGHGERVGHLEPAHRSVTHRASLREEHLARLRGEVRAELLDGFPQRGPPPVGGRGAAPVQRHAVAVRSRQDATVARASLTLRSRIERDETAETARLTTVAAKAPTSTAATRTRRASEKLAKGRSTR